MRKKETPNPSRVRGRGVEVSETLFYARNAAGKECYFYIRFVKNLINKFFVTD